MNGLNVWQKEQLFVILCIIVSAIMTVMSYYHYSDSQTYIPKPQQMLLDIYHRPIGSQNLLEDTEHNPHYRTGNNGEAGADYAKESLLNMFTYNKGDLTSGKVLERFQQAFTEGEGERVYQGIFVNLSQPRIVMAQDALVRARIIGQLEYNGKAEWPYQTISGLSMTARTHQYKGKMMITVYGEDTFPTLYDFVIVVQRALLQDKITGYQILTMELY